MMVWDVIWFLLYIKYELTMTYIYNLDNIFTTLSQKHNRTHKLNKNDDNIWMWLWEIFEHHVSKWYFSNFPAFRNPIMCQTWFARKRNSNQLILKAPVFSRYWLVMDFSRFISGLWGWLGFKSHLRVQIEHWVPFYWEGMLQDIQS